MNIIRNRIRSKSRRSGPVAPLDSLAGITAAFSHSRTLLTAYGGNLRTLDGAAITEWLDQSGNSRDVTQGSTASQPQDTTAGPNARACSVHVQGSFSNDFWSGASLSTFINNNEGYIIASVIVDSITFDAGNPWSNHAVWVDGGAFAGMFFRNASTPEFESYAWDGNPDTATVMTTPALATTHICEWRHQGGTLYSRLDKGTEVSTPHGNTSSISGAFNVGANGSNAAGFNGKIFELVTFDTVPSLTERDALVDDMSNWVG